MHWMEAFKKRPWPLYLVGGLIVGMFVGYRVLPQLMPRTTAPVSAADSASQIETAQRIEEKLAAGLVQLEAVKDAHVQLSVSLAGTKRAHAKAAVTLTLAGAELSDEQLAGISEQVAAGVGGLKPGHVAIVDASGRSLNREAVMQQERKQFWTNIAINIAKILGILAALITVRYIIRAIGKSVLGEDAKC